MARGQDMSHAKGTPDAPTQEGFGKYATLFRSDIGGLHNSVYSILDVMEGPA